MRRMIELCVPRTNPFLPTSPLPVPSPSGKGVSPLRRGKRSAAGRQVPLTPSQRGKGQGIGVGPGQPQINLVSPGPSVRADSVVFSKRLKSRSLTKRVSFWQSAPKHFSNSLRTFLKTRTANEHWPSS